MIYWDNNATTPLAPEVLDAMLPYLREQHYNPSANYAPAKRVRAAIERARAQVAQLIGAEPDEIIFTSGGTEASNTALAQMGDCLACATDHHATLHSPYVKTPCPVDSEGRLDLRAWEQLLPQHQGASLSWANAETGVIQDLPQLADLTRQAGVRLHVDAVATAAKMPIAVHDYPIDFLSLSAHKIHGPKGVGALYVRRGVPYRPYHHGSSHESARRAGTEHVAGIIGFGMAAQCAQQEAPRYRELSQLRDALIAQLRASDFAIVVQGEASPRVGNVASLRFPSYRAESLSLLLEASGLLCSAGSACASANPRPSHVLTAMGLSDEEAREVLRFSLSRTCTSDEIEQGAASIIAALRRIQSVQSLQTGPVTVYKP